MNDDLTPHLRQFMHNDGSGFVAGYDVQGIDRLVAYLKAKAIPQFESADDLIAWLDGLHETEGTAITNRKWGPAQKAIAALRGPLKRGTTGVCYRGTCICEREGLGNECIWLRPATQEASKEPT